MKLESTEEFVKLLNSMTSRERNIAFPNVFSSVSANFNNEQNNNILLTNDAILWKMCVNHMQLMNHKVKKGDIYPCDKDGNIVAPPTENRKEVSLAFYNQEMKAYKEAESRILFELPMLEAYQIKLITSGNYSAKSMISLISINTKNDLRINLQNISVHLTQAGIDYLTR